jgi:NAD(P)-dependent dehydrogenase (short-subunit alcohol dehydrogenase family)
MDLRNKVVLVTGGAVRIGRAISVALARRGCHIVVHCHRSGSQARELVTELNSIGVNASVVAADLRKPSEADRLIHLAQQASGGLHCLVNNAAVFHKTPILSTTRLQWESEWQINALAPALLTRAFAKALATSPAKGKGSIAGKIVNILDQRVAHAESGCASYLLTKKWLGAFTEIAAMELAPRFTVNAVAPGAVLPPSRRRGHSSEPAGARLLFTRPTPDDVAGAVAFLLESDSITGQTVFVDSGQRLASHSDSGTHR